MTRNPNDNLYYIHGYLSSPDGTKGQLFKTELNAEPIKYRDVPAEQLVIKDCLKEISQVIDSDDTPTLIGSSLGGLLAAKIALQQKVKTLILLNPAIIPPYVDISLIQDMPQRILKDMQDKELFTKTLESRIIIFLGSHDELVPSEWSIEFAIAQDGVIHFFYVFFLFFHLMQHLPSMIEKFL